MKSNGQSEIVSFCLVFRAFWQINSTASWPTVPPFPHTLQWANPELDSTNDCSVLESAQGGDVWEQSQDCGGPFLAEWFTYGVEIFNCLKGKTYLPRLPGIFLIARHFQKQLEVVCFISLFRAAEGKRNNRSKVLKSVYSLQPKGEQHLGGTTSRAIHLFL